jgi:hypothetical protein
MSKRIYIGAIAFLVLASSCKKELNQLPISQGTTATFYHSPSDFIQGVNAIYNNLRGYPDRLLNLSEIRSDNIYGVSVTVRDWDPINNFSPGIASNVYVEEAWNSDMNGIFKANTLLEQVAVNGTYIGSSSLSNRLQAEARYLRAFYYFDLVRYFGKVPVLDHPVLVPEANSINRSSVSDVYAFILADLQFAVANLPVSYTGVDVGRATKYAAEATLAQVYMTRSGPTYGIEGPGVAANEWNLALPLLNDIIASGQFALNPNFANIFSYTNQSPTPAGNKEAIFDVMYVSGQNPVLGATYPWGLAPNGYFQSINDKNSNGSLEIIPVSNSLLNSYAPTDVRKPVTIYTAGFTISSGAETRPFFKKYLDVSRIPAASRFDWGINFIAIRYTDILMLKSECVLHGAPGSQATDVDGVVNQVRQRAGLPALSNVNLAMLLEERRREFADEGLRWFDLQRSGSLLTIMNAWINSEDVQHRINQVTANYVIYPVPQSQLDAAPGLYQQNQGY